MRFRRRGPRDVAGWSMVAAMADFKRHGHYLLFRLIKARGPDATVLDWLDELTAGCAKKRVNDMHDQCAARCPDLPKVL